MNPMIDFNMILGSVTEIEQGADGAWKFMLRVGVAAIFAFGAFKMTKESKAAPWKLHVNSMLIAAATAIRKYQKRWWICILLGEMSRRMLPAP
jgi:hypothetical protein